MSHVFIKLLNRGDCAGISRQNWLALKRIAADHSKSLRTQHQDWALEELMANLNLPRTALMLDMAATAGFVGATEPAVAEVYEVLTQQMNGVHSLEVIANTAGICVQKVQRLLEISSAGYCKAPFGCTAYGGYRAVSDGKTAVARRTTIKGQLSYRGKRYSLGALYRGRTVFAREKEGELLITCNDRSPLHVTRYPAW